MLRGDSWVIFATQQSLLSSCGSFREISLVGTSSFLSGIKKQKLFIKTTNFLSAVFSFLREAH